MLFRRAASAPATDTESVEAALDRTVGPVDDATRHILERARPFTMTSWPRLMATIDAVDYVVRRAVPGSFAECGVWRGGMVLAMVLRLQQLGVNDRDIYLFDTFEGMTKPTELDTSEYDKPALATWSEAEADGRPAWDGAFTPDVYRAEDVTRLITDTGYPAERIHVVIGPVEDTIPAQAPAAPIALLRLDTDWYESTKHELVHLYPSLTSGGVLLIDDYGHWDGCRRAVDEYFAAAAPPLLLSRIDYTGRMAVKT